MSIVDLLEWHVQIEALPDDPEGEVVAKGETHAGTCRWTGDHSVEPSEPGVVLNQLEPTQSNQVEGKQVQVYTLEVLDGSV